MGVEYIEQESVVPDKGIDFLIVGVTLAVALSGTVLALGLYMSSLFLSS